MKVPKFKIWFSKKDTLKHLLIILFLAKEVSKKLDILSILGSLKSSFNLKPSGLNHHISSSDTISKSS